MKENNKISKDDIVLVRFPLGEQTNTPAHRLDGEQFVVKSKRKPRCNKGGDIYLYELYGAESKAGKPYVFLSDELIRL